MNDEDLQREQQKHGWVVEMGMFILAVASLVGGAIVYFHDDEGPNDAPTFVLSTIVFGILGIICNRLNNSNKKK